jgi:hypothetical protein
MAEANRPSDSEIFDGGPPFRLEKSLGLIKPDQRRSVQRALVEVLVVVLAYLAMIILMQTFPTEDIPFWHKASGDGAGYSWAGWWHTLVSAPVALVLLLG